MAVNAALTLRPVCTANAEAVIGLPLHAAQRDFIASNAESLALAASHANMHPRAIHAGDELIGFAMYALPGSAGRQDTHVLYRLMIAAPWQGQGFARVARAGWCSITCPPMCAPGSCTRTPVLSRQDSTTMAR